MCTFQLRVLMMFKPLQVLGGVDVLVPVLGWYTWTVVEFLL
jgi:hypothetical protein